MTTLWATLGVELSNSLRGTGQKLGRCDSDDTGAVWQSPIGRPEAMTESKCERHIKNVEPCRKGHGTGMSEDLK